MRYIVTLVTSLLLLAQVSFAKSYSYIYIEGDKQTPFYVKLEGQMLPRLGKNYCIIPNLDEGIINIEILFQQNKFPAQKFMIKVPAEGSRGFVLQKVNDRQFALYDIQQGLYLVSGNKAEDDKLPEAASAEVVLPVKQVTAVPVTSANQNTRDQEETLPAFTPNKKTKKKTPPKPVTEEVAPKQTDNGNRFISDIELNADGTTNSAPVSGGEPVSAPKNGKKVVTQKKPVKVKTEEGSLAAISGDEEEGVPVKTEPVADQGIPNSDCKSPMSSDDFENFALKILDKADDDARLKVLRKNKGRLCFTTEQVRIIANNLDTQSGRYEVVKMLYAQTSDQSNYPQLESLFKTPYLKTKFRDILNPGQQ